jgi:hypothetical protein
MEALPDGLDRNKRSVSRIGFLIQSARHLHADGHRLGLNSKERALCTSPEFVSASNMDCGPGEPRTRVSRRIR